MKPARRKMFTEFGNRVKSPTSITYWRPVPDSGTNNRLMMMKCKLRIAKLYLVTIARCPCIRYKLKIYTKHFNQNLLLAGITIMDKTIIQQ